MDIKEKEWRIAPGISWEFESLASNIFAKTNLDEAECFERRAEWVLLLRSDWRNMVESGADPRLAADEVTRSFGSPTMLVEEIKRGFRGWFWRLMWVDRYRVDRHLFINANAQLAIFMNLVQRFQYLYVADNEWLVSYANYSFSIFTGVACSVCLILGRWLAESRTGLWLARAVAGFLHLIIFSHYWKAWLRVVPDRSDDVLRWISSVVFVPMSLFMLVVSTACFLSESGLLRWYHRLFREKAESR